MNLHQIRYFLAVAETGGFTKAAERVLVSQPTLSAGIKKLERDLGVRLFERDRRRVALTAAGARFLDRARAIVAEVGAARAELMDDGDRTRLRLGALRTVPAATLARLVGDFAKAESGVRIEIRDGTEAELDAWLAGRRIDLALTVLGPGAEDAAPQAMPLFRSRLRLALPGDHPLARGGRLRLERLAALPFVVRLHCEFLTESRRRFEAHKVRPHIVCRTDQDERALALAAAGVGGVLVPDRLQGPGLVLVPVVELDLGHTVGLRWRPDGETETVDAFRAFAASHDWRPRPAEQAIDRRLGWAH